MKKARLAKPGDTMSSCVLCDRAIRDGEAVLLFRLDTKDFADPNVYQHVACMAAVVDAAPESEMSPIESQAFIAQLRREHQQRLDQLRASGTLVE